MKPPRDDIEERVGVWDAMQHIWMDTDPAVLLSGIARVCAASAYTIEELEAIYWNEVRPAVSFNLLALPAPEWAGFEIGWLTERVLKTSRFGKPLPRGWLHPYASRWWHRLRADIVQHRTDAPGL